MAFSNTVLTEYSELGSGEVLQAKPSNVEAFETFEDGLVQGRFCKYDTGSVDNLDNSATPVIAGVTVRDITQATETNTYDSTRTPAGDDVAMVCTFGFCTVDVVTGDTPVKYGIAYAVNAAASGANFGKATTTSLNNEDSGWVFWEQKATDVWLLAKAELV